MNKYEQEAKEKYGKEVVEASNQQLKGYSIEQLQEIENLSNQINENLKEALMINDPACEKAQLACEYHEKWLKMMWPKGLYSKEAHFDLVQCYLEDERFVSYYDRNGEGCTKLLVAAMKLYLGVKE